MSGREGLAMVGQGVPLITMDSVLEIETHAETRVIKYFHCMKRMVHLIYVEEGLALTPVQINTKPAKLVATLPTTGAQWAGRRSA